MALQSYNWHLFIQLISWGFYYRITNVFIQDTKTCQGFVIRKLQGSLYILEKVPRSCPRVKAKTEDKLMEASISCGWVDRSKMQNNPWNEQSNTTTTSICKERFSMIFWWTKKLNGISTDFPSHFWDGCCHTWRADSLAICSRMLRNRFKEPAKNPISPQEDEWLSNCFPPVKIMRWTPGLRSHEQTSPNTFVCEICAYTLNRDPGCRKGIMIIMYVFERNTGFLTDGRKWQLRN